MYIGPWQEYQLGKLLHQQREPLNRHATLAKAGLALLQSGRNRVSNVGSEPSEKSYYSAPVSIGAKSKKAPSKSGKKLETRSRRIPERIDRMRALYGLDTKQMTPSCTPAPTQPSGDGGVPPSLAHNIPFYPPSPMKDKKEEIVSGLASSSGWIYDSSSAKYGLDTKEMTPSCMPTLTQPSGDGGVPPSLAHNIPFYPPSPMKNLKVEIVSGLASLGWVYDSSSAGMLRGDDRGRKEKACDNMARGSSGTPSPSKMAPVCDNMARGSSGTPSALKMVPVKMPRRTLFERSGSSMEEDFPSAAKKSVEESLLHHVPMRDRPLRLSMHGEDGRGKQQHGHERHAGDDGKVPHRGHQPTPSSLEMEGDSLSYFASPLCSPVPSRTEGKKPPRAVSPVPTRTQKCTPGAPISPFRVSHTSTSSMKCASVTGSFAAGDDLISWARNLTFEDIAIPGM